MFIESVGTTEVVSMALVSSILAGFKIQAEATIVQTIQVEATIQVVT